VTPLEALRALGPGEEPPPEAKERVGSRLFAALEAAALASPSTSGGTGTGTGTGAAASVRPVALFGGVAGSKVLAGVVVVWLMGGITGAALYRAWRPSEVRVVYLDRPLAAPSSPVPVPVPVPLSAPFGVTSGTAMSSAADRTSPSSAVISSSDLARERALLDVARAAASHGEPAQVLAVVAQHRAQFPHGRLSEERDALAIRALSSLGRTAEARTRAEAFRAAYPNSFLIPALESALSAP
jgi:hypothetical protein